MKDTPMQQGDNYKGTLRAIATVFKLSVCNFFFLVAVGSGEGYGAAMSANAQIAPRVEDIFDIVYDIDDYVCLTSIVMSVLFLMFVK